MSKMIDFTKLATIIPEKGTIKFTIKKNDDGTLTVLFESKHELMAHPSTYDKDLKGQSDTLQEMRKSLDKTIPFTGSPEKLTESFEELITARQTAAKELADAIGESTAELKAKIDELKKKTAAKPAAKTPATSQDKTASAKRIKEVPAPKGATDGEKTTQASGTLFATEPERQEAEDESEAA